MYIFYNVGSYIKLERNILDLYTTDWKYANHIKKCLNITL